MTVLDVSVPQYNAEAIKDFLAEIDSQIGGMQPRQAYEDFVAIEEVRIAQVGQSLEAKGVQLSDSDTLLALATGGWAVRRCVKRVADADPKRVLTEDLYPAIEREVMKDALKRDHEVAVVGALQVIEDAKHWAIDRSAGYIPSVLAYDVSQAAYRVGVLWQRSLSN